MPASAFNIWAIKAGCTMRSGTQKNKGNSLVPYSDLCNPRLKIAVRINWNYKLASTPKRQIHRHTHICFVINTGSFFDNLRNWCNSRMNGLFGSDRSVNYFLAWCVNNSQRSNSSVLHMCVNQLYTSVLRCRKFKYGATVSAEDDKHGQICCRRVFGNFCVEPVRKARSWSSKITTSIYGYYC